jgi:hypothetical protein
MIPDVQTPDPTEKGNKNLSRSEKGNIFRGHLIFTNKGVYFVQLYEFREKRAADLLTSDSNYTILGFILGGVVGGYIGRKIDEKVQKPSEKHQTNIQAAWKRVEEETQASKDLKALLEKGHSVLPYRKESIVSISFDSKKGLEIRATGKSPPQVFFMVTEEAYKKTEPMIKEYLAT